MKKSLCYVLLCLLSLFIYNLKAEDKKFVVIICSYNNAKFYKKNLDSLFKQKYQKYRVIYIDDGSTDGTADLVERYVKQNKFDKRFTLIRNKTRQRKTKNIYNVYRTVSDKDIIVQLDGDDWFAHENVLSKLNQVYQNPNVWLTYGSYKDSDGKPGYATGVSNKIINQNLYRKAKWRYMPVRSFYAWLFKLIKLKNFLSNSVEKYKGKFFPASNDLMMMYPMLEMTGGRFKYIKDILYIRNRLNPLSGFKSDKRSQILSNFDIRKSKRYTELSKPLINRLNKYSSFTVISIDISQLKSLGKKLRFLSSVSDYILLIIDKSLFVSEKNMHKYILDLEDTFAQCSFLSTSKFSLFKNNKFHQPEHLRDNIYCFKFNINNSFRYIFDASKAMLIRKKTLLKILNNKEINTLQDIKTYLLKLNKVGLCYI